MTLIVSNIFMLITNIKMINGQKKKNQNSLISSQKSNSENFKKNY